MNFLDDLIQNLFNVIDQLFWFSSEIGQKRLKKWAVINCITYHFFSLLFTYKIIHKLSATINVALFLVLTLNKCIKKCLA